MQRDARVAAVVASLERELQLVAVTGVEDRLQEDVRESLEMLRSAGVRVWMLTGDKVETATCVAISTKLVRTAAPPGPGTADGGQQVSKSQSIFHFQARTRAEAVEQLSLYMQKRGACFVIDGGPCCVCARFIWSDAKLQARRCRSAWTTWPRTLSQCVLMFPAFPRLRLILCADGVCCARSGVLPVLAHAEGGHRATHEDPGQAHLVRSLPLPSHPSPVLTGTARWATAATTWA
jgi:hypothetical protein